MTDDQIIAALMERKQCAATELARLQAMDTERWDEETLDQHDIDINTASLEEEAAANAISLIDAIVSEHAVRTNT